MYLFRDKIIVFPSNFANVLYSPPNLISPDTNPYTTVYKWIPSSNFQISLRVFPSVISLSLPPVEIKFPFTSSSIFLDQIAPNVYFCESLSRRNSKGRDNPSRISSLFICERIREFTAHCVHSEVDLTFRRRIITGRTGNIARASRFEHSNLWILFSCRRMQFHDLSLSQFDRDFERSSIW